MFNIGGIFVVLIFLCIAAYHFLWHKEFPDRLILLIIMLSMGIFIYIFFDHVIECHEIDEKYRQDKDKWIREYMNSDYVNTNNKSFKLLLSFMKHPYLNGGSTKYYNKFGY